ncbi:MAG TPA: hypothetical protein GXX28_01505, partial [Firmicutes bacterium]|nr:hypothetical protein [Bacillota bacterium]
TATLRAALPPVPARLAACSCGEVLQGLKLPTECKLFGKACTPGTPVGPCMVSSEGSCAAYYRYERHARPAQRRIEA